MGMGVDTPARGTPERARGGRGRSGAPLVRVSLLDRFAVAVDGAERRMGAAERRLVALAALHPRPLRRSQVAFVLWPHLNGANAAASVRSTLSRVRSACPSLIASDSRSVRLADHVCVDAWELEALASRLIAGSDEIPEDLVLSRLGAELLPDWAEDWVVFERERLHDICMHAIEAHAIRLADARRFAQAIVTVHEALRADPLLESAARTLIEIHLAEGNRVRAVRCYLDFRRRCLAGLGVEPSAEMEELIRPLLRKRDRLE